MSACVLVHIQNIRRQDVADAIARDELAAHIFRKGYMDRFYDTRFVVLGRPQKTDKYSVESLELMGMMGVYGYQRVNREAA